MAAIQIPATCEICNQNPVEGVLSTYWWDGTGPKWIEFVCGTCGPTRETPPPQPVDGMGDSHYVQGQHLDQEWLERMSKKFD